MSHIFGPVPSRRLGFSLGVDVTPLKVCSLNCVYCQLGRTTRETIERKEYVPAGQILEELKKVLSLDQRIDYITFSGSGEPTLNSKIGEMIRRIKEMTSIPVAVLTNGTLLFEKEVRDDLQKADLVIPSLDAVSEDVFEKINRPHGRLRIDRIIEGLVDFRREFQGQIWLEIMLVKGINDSPDEIQKIKRFLPEINPDKVQLNTVVRPPAEKFVRPLTAEELGEVRGILGDKCEVIAEFKQKEQFVYKEDVEEAIVTLLKRRPVTLNDISTSLGLHRNEITKYLEVLKKDGKIKPVIFGNDEYYKF